MAGKGTVLVGDLMTRRPVCIAPGTTMPALTRLFEQHKVSGFPIVNDQGQLVGVVSQTDLIRRCLTPIGDEAPGFFFQEVAEQIAGASGTGDQTEGGLDAESLIVVADIMTTDVVTAKPEELLAAVAKRMVDQHVHRVVVVGPSREPMGIITSMDMLRALAG